MATLPITSLQAGREPLIESLDLSVPLPPVLVKIDGSSHLVYELHLSNFRATEVVLKRLEVTSPQKSLGSYEGDALTKIIGRPGLRSDHATPLSLAAGLRAVVFFWIPLAEGGEVPREVAHRLTVDVLGPSGAVETTLEGLPVKITGDAPAVLDPPLRGGPWAAIYEPHLKGGHRTAFYTLDGKARIPGRFAIDWVRLTAEGAMDVANVARSAQWNGYGAEVLAVADGVIAAAVDDMPDNPEGSKPGTFPQEAASGNYVALDLGGGRFAFYEHLKQNSIRVKSGERVKRGQVIAALGNSGSSSIGPHLHFHVSNARETLAAEGLPFVFRRFRHLGAFSSIEALVGGEKWNPRSDAKSDSRQSERPGPNAVVQFP